MQITNSLPLNTPLVHLFTIKEITKIETVCKGWRASIYAFYTTAERIEQEFPLYSIRERYPLHWQLKCLHRIPFNIKRGIFSVSDVNALFEPALPEQLNTPKYLITRHRKCTLTFFNKVTRESIECPGHTVPGASRYNPFINDIQVTPDGTRVITAASDRTLKVWELSTGALVHTLVGHEAAVEAVRIRRDSNIALSIDGRGSIIVWYLPTGRIIQTFSLNCDYILAFELSPNQNYLYVSHSPKTMAIVILSSRIISQIDLHAPITSIAFSSDRRMMITSNALSLDFWNKHYRSMILNTISLPKGIVHQRSNRDWECSEITWMKLSEDGTQLILRNKFAPAYGEGHFLKPFANVLDFLNLSNEQTRIVSPWTPEED